MDFGLNFTANCDDVAQPPHQNETARLEEHQTGGGDVVVRSDSAAADILMNGHGEGGGIRYSLEHDETARVEEHQTGGGDVVVRSDSAAADILMNGHGEGGGIRYSQEHDETARVEEHQTGGGDVLVRSDSAVDILMDGHGEGGGIRYSQEHETASTPLRQRQSENYSDSGGYSVRSTNTGRPFAVITMLPLGEVMPLGGGYGEIGLSEEVIFRHLTVATRNCEDMDAGLCAVCLDALNEKIGVLDCGHEYHYCCIIQWLQRKNICPLCMRQALRVEN